MPALREHFPDLPDVWISQTMASFRSKRADPQSVAAPAAVTGASDEKQQQLRAAAPADAQHPQRRSHSPTNAEHVHSVVRRLYLPAQQQQLCVHQQAHAEPDDEHSETCPLSAQVQWRGALAQHLLALELLRPRALNHCVSVRDFFSHTAQFSFHNVQCTYTKPNTCTVL